MANSFKSNVAINVQTTGNVVYTCPAATETTLIGMTLSNKSNTTTVTANVFLTRSTVDYSIISNATLPVGSSLVPVGGDQKIVLQPADQIKVVVSTNNAVDVITSLLEIS
jgi:hypothetical protein